MTNSLYLHKTAVISYFQAMEVINKKIVICLHFLLFVHFYSYLFTFSAICLHFQLFVYKTHHLLTKNTTRDRAMPTITVTMTTIDRSTGMLRAVWTLDDERKNPPFWLVWTEVLSSFGTQVKSTGVHEPFWRHWLSTRRVRLAEKKNWK